MWELNNVPKYLIVFPCGRTVGQKNRHDEAFRNFANAPKNSSDTVNQWRAEGGGECLGVQTPSEIPKALQNRAKVNPIVKT